MLTIPKFSLSLGFTLTLLVAAGLTPLPRPLARASTKHQNAETWNSFYHQTASQRTSGPFCWLVQNSG
jgi:hypothetical protein